MKKNDTNPSPGTGTTHVVPLITNQSYTTYQFYAFMANPKTQLEDGLRYAALTTLKWIRLRLGEGNVPDALRTPGPEAYRDKTVELKGYYYNDGYMLNVISLPDKGIWTLQLVEPDMSSNPGEANPKKKAVPGRTFTTNIGYYINPEKGKLECGFQTVVSQPRTIGEKADVFRLAIIRELMEGEPFGFEIGLPVNGKPIRVGDAATYRKVLDVIRSDDNQLPVVGYRAEPRLPVPDFDVAGDFRRIKTARVKESVTSADELAGRRFSHGFVCVFEETWLARLKDEFGSSVTDNDVFILNPKKYSGSVTVPNPAVLIEKLNRYHSNRNYSFGSVHFVPQARALLSAGYQTLDELRAALSELTNENSTLRQQASRFSESRETEELKDRIRDLETEKAQQKNELEGKISELDTQNANLKEQVKKLKAKKQELSAQVFQLTNADSKPKDIPEEPTLSRMTLKEKPGYISGVDNIINYFETQFADRMVFSEDAKSSAKGCYIKESTLWKLFYAYAVVLWELKYADDSSKNLDTEFQRRTGFELALTPGMMTGKDKDKMNERIREYNGRTIDITPHTTLTCGQRANQSVHFAWLDDERKICIAHCGEHLPVYRTYK